MLKKLQESNPSSSPSQNSPTVMSSLSPLADAMVELSQRQGFTPVIVTPMVVTLEPVFFVELSKALLSRIEQDLRFDWNRQVSTGLPIFGDYWASRHARKVNRQLTRHISTGTLTASMQITALIARPGGPKRQFVVGWCDQQQSLPSWVVPIHIGGQLTPRRDMDVSNALQSPRKLAA